MTLHSCH